MAITVGMVSLGCSKNQIDAEHLLSDLQKDTRFCITSDLETAQAVVINTCAFVESAQKESIDTILEFAEKKGGRLLCIAVTGCLAQRYQNELAKELPEVDVVLGIGANDRIAEAIFQAVNGHRVVEFGPKEALLLEHDRVLTTPSYVAYLKIAEGCNNFCTYCAIPQIRGRFRSRPMQSILKEAHWLADQGVRELIVVAQDTSRYGEDLYGDTKLAELLDELSKLDFLWIRVLYCYPERINDRLLSVLNRHENLLPYIDMPIQHINDEILKKMNRHTNSRQIWDAIHSIRRALPGAVLRTSLIAGFPGETQQQFEELAQFVCDAKFDRLGCFAYSQEEGTPAAKLPGQLDEQTKNRRAEIIMLEQQKVLEQRGQQQIGTQIQVLTEAQTEHGYIGRSAADAPEVDCNVYFSCSRVLQPGSMVEVLVESSQQGDLFGTAR